MGRGAETPEPTLATRPRAGRHHLPVPAIFLMVAAFVYTSLLWAAFFGYAIFGDAPTATRLIGAAVIVASALYIVEREARLTRARGKAAAQHQVLGSPEAEAIIVKREDMQ